MNRNEFFAALRPAFPDQRFPPASIPIIDDLADKLGMARTGDNDWLPYALSLIKHFEGCELTAYPDPGTGGKPYTIGWGSTSDSTGKAIALGTRWTQQQADTRLAEHVAEFARGVDKALAGSPVTGPQKGALVSFAYNVGLGSLGSSTLLRKHRAGDYAGAAAEFSRWSKAAGKVLNGLVKRRAAEARVYQGLAL